MSETALATALETTLVTGGLGYIGSHVCVELANKNYQVVVVDNLSNCHRNNCENLLKLTHNKVKIYVGDASDIEFMRTIFMTHKIDKVIHLAGYKAVGESVSHPLKYYNNNIKLLLTLLQVMTEHSCKTLIFSSSATVYGSNSRMFYDETAPTGVNLTNPYGKTKYFQEEILKDLYISDNTWNIVILRYFNPVGNHKSGLIGENTGTPYNLFPCIIKALQDGTQIKIYGNTYNTHDGTCIRDYIHVVDLASAHIHVLASTGLNIYNVGTGKEISVLDIIKTFEQSNNIKINYVVTDKRNGDVERLCANPSKIISDTGWQTKFTLEDMCKDSYLFSLNSCLL